MAGIEVTGSKLDVDDHDHMRAPEQRNLAIAHLTEAEDVSGMDEDRSKLLHYINDYYEKFGIAPPTPKLCKKTGVPLKRIREFFPNGISMDIRDISKDFHQRSVDCNINSGLHKRSVVMNLKLMRGLTETG